MRHADGKFHKVNALCMLRKKKEERSDRQ